MYRDMYRYMYRYISSCSEEESMALRAAAARAFDYNRLEHVQHNYVCM